jgi:hypothetical protein
MIGPEFSVSSVFSSDSSSRADNSDSSKMIECHVSNSNDYA